MHQIASTTNWGRPPQHAFDHAGTHPQSKTDSFADGVQRTLYPIMTGTSVLGLKYKDGVMIATDTLASFGSLAKIGNTQRLHPVGQNTVIGAGGDLSDFQYIQSVLDQLIIDEFSAQDNHSLGAREIHAYLGQLMYGRRSKMNPLWNSLLVGGVKDGDRFLACVDLLGTTYSASTLATGFGAHVALPVLRNEVEGRENKLTEEEGLAILEKCMRLLFYRDARSWNKFQVAIVNAAGVTISEPKELETSWTFAENLRGYGNVSN